MSRKLTHEELQTRQVDLSKQPKLPFSIVLNNIRSLYNVGSIFRTADGAGIEKIWICGITGIPPDTQISKTALGAEKVVPWEYVRDIKTCVHNLKKLGYEIIILEQIQGAQCYQNYRPSNRPVCLIIGNETQGVDPELLNMCDVPLEIEMAGLKNSLNVTVAFGIVAYHIRNQLKR